MDPFRRVAMPEDSEVILQRRLSFVIVAAQVKQELLQVHGIVIHANRIPSTQPTKGLEISSGWHPDTSRLRSYPEPCFDICNETKLFCKAAGGGGWKGSCMDLKLAGIICNSACKDVPLKADICFNS